MVTSGQGRLDKNHNKQTIVSKLSHLEQRSHDPETRVHIRECSYPKGYEVQFQGIMGGHGKFYLHFTFYVRKHMSIQYILYPVMIS